MTSDAKKKSLDQKKNLPRVVAVGAKLSWWEDFYHWVLVLTWPRFFVALACSFAVANCLFAAVYSLQPGCIEKAENFWDHFFFSVQTLGTIGYGAMAPHTRYGNVVVSIESFLGVITNALITGFTFARFSRPTARVLFCEKAVIQKRNGVPHLMFRLANWRRNQIAEANLHATILVLERTTEGETLRRPNPLKLVRSWNPMFILSWTVMHEIDEASPFYGQDAMQKLRDQEAQIFLSVTGLDETISATVHARYRYLLEDIVPNARFVDVVSTQEDGTRVIDFDKFHEIEVQPS